MRPTPTNLDKSAKFLEYIMVFLFTALMSMPLLELWGVVIGIVATVLTIFLTAGKQPGFASEWLYTLGLDLQALLPRKLKRLDH